MSVATKLSSMYGSSWLLSSILHSFLVTVNYAKEAFFSPISNNRRSFLSCAWANYVHSRSTSAAKQSVEFFRIFVYYIVWRCTQKPHIPTSHFGLPLLNTCETVIYIFRIYLETISIVFVKGIPLSYILERSTRNTYQSVRGSLLVAKWRGVLNQR